jgi:hypothetical protein
MVSGIVLEKARHLVAVAIGQRILNAELPAMALFEVLGCEGPLAWQRSGERDVAGKSGSYCADRGNPQTVQPSEQRRR